MAERPILFSAPMVRAILDGRKTQTRRVIKPQPISIGDKVVAVLKYRIRDRLWVRETWHPYGDDGKESLALATSTCTGPEHVCFRATADEAQCATYHWRPSIHMPRWASRITLEITNVRVQRLQDISEKDAKAEGVERLKSGRGYYSIKHGRAAVHFGVYHDDAKEAFAELWDSINGAGAWDANPWVYALTFRRVAGGTNG
jgi:hypothetical protein